ncbi:hypothetical protein [Cryobacterium sp. Y57]|nr:hypothetical protein [Cryobacterium sp. Y57]
MALLLAVITQALAGTGLATVFLVFAAYAVGKVKSSVPPCFC